MLQQRGQPRQRHQRSQRQPSLALPMTEDSLRDLLRAALRPDMERAAKDRRRAERDQLARAAGGLAAGLLRRPE